jgi:hypothetical protein
MVRASNLTLLSPAAAFWAFLFRWYSKRPQNTGLLRARRLTEMAWTGNRGNSQNRPRGEKKLAHFDPHFRMT